MNCRLNQNRHSGPGFHRDKLQPESSSFKTFWMPPYQVRGRLLRSGMTEKAVYGRTLSRVIAGLSSGRKITMKRLACLVALLLFVSGLSVGVSATCAQTYPNRPIQLIIPNVPGAIVDINARALAEELERFSGHRSSRSTNPVRERCWAWISLPRARGMAIPSPTQGTQGSCMPGFSIPKPCPTIPIRIWNPWDCMSSFRWLLRCRQALHGKPFRI